MAHAVEPGLALSLPARRANRAVAIWLFTVAGMMIVMVGLGAYVMNDGAGLSMMTWKPVNGVIPPTSHAAWERMFALYKTIPQYKLLHPDMTLAGFQAIFWPEYMHRMLGRAIGVAFALPLIVFALTGQLERRQIPWLVLLLFLGGMEGVVGWFMVSSGFDAHSTAVQPWRLSLHFCYALLLFAAVLWTALVEWRPTVAPVAGGRTLKRLTMASIVAVAVTIFAGTIVAGINADDVYKEFPLMGAGLIPPGYASLHPFWLNWFANKGAVQFNHRLFATLAAVLTLATVVVAWRKPLPRGLRNAFLAVGGLVLLQYALGVTALVTSLTGFDNWHIVNAVLLLGALVWALAGLRAVR